MVRRKKEALERLADLLLLDEAMTDGYVTSTKNRHGFGKWLRERGILHGSWEAEIAKHEKFGFEPEQIDKLLAEGGADRKTRQRYSTNDDKIKAATRGRGNRRRNQESSGVGNSPTTEGDGQSTDIVGSASGRRSPTKREEG